MQPSVACRPAPSRLLLSGAGVLLLLPTLSQAATALLVSFFP